ncbi:MAG: GNAT family N-acetyltransferase [Bacteroidota bacterium]|nr:GNAT family N-acetyltransferase [Bacteroidota bacterium]
MSKTNEAVKLQFKHINKNTQPDPNFSKGKIAEFLFKHLEQYGDPREDILKCMDYALEENGGQGGFILLGLDDSGEIAGALIMNRTGMSGYIPENILVYIAVDAQHRGKGYGRQIMEKALELAEGNVALHVEPDNPAKYLYENIGFTNKYLEMRYQKK